MAWFDYRGPKDHDDGMAWLQFALQTGIETTCHYAGVEIHVVRALYKSGLVTAVVAGSEFCGVVGRSGTVVVDEKYQHLFGNLPGICLAHDGFQAHYRELHRLRPVA